MSRIVQGMIAPVDGKKVLAAFQLHTNRKLAEHAPGTAAPDYDHPLVRTLVERLPRQTYEDLERVKRHLEKHGLQATQTSPQVVDGMLRLVNQELQRRDRLREMDAVSLIDLLTKGTL